MRQTATSNLYLVTFLLEHVHADFLTANITRRPSSPLLSSAGTFKTGGSGGGGRVLGCSPLLCHSPFPSPFLEKKYIYLYPLLVFLSPFFFSFSRHDCNEKKKKKPPPHPRGWARAMVGRRILVLVFVLFFIDKPINLKLVLVFFLSWNGLGSTHTHTHLPSFSLFHLHSFILYPIIPHISIPTISYILSYQRPPPHTSGRIQKKKVTNWSRSHDRVE